MGYRSSALLVLLALGLLGYLLFVEENNITTPEARERALALLPGGREDIVALTLSSGEETIRVERRAENHWEVTAPLPDLADEEEISSLLVQIDYARAARVLTEDDPSYGLSSPSASLQISLQDGGVLRLTFGEDAVGGRHAYARREDTKEILLLPRSLKEAVSRDIQRLRQRRALPFSRASLLALTAEQKDTPRLAIALQEGRWQISSPQQGRLDPTRREAILRALEGLTILRFLDETEPDLGRYGLLSPSGTIEMKTEGATLTLLIGDATEDAYGAPARYAKRQHFPGVFLLPESALAALQPPEGEMRDTRFFSHTLRDISALTLKQGDESFRVERYEKGWRSLPPGELDSTELEAFVQALSEIPVLSFAPLDEGAETLATLEVSLQGEAGTFDRFTLQKPQEGGPLWAVREGEGVKVEVPRALLDLITPDPLRFRPRQILSVRTSNASSLQIIRPTGEIFVRKEGASWKLSAPTNAPADRRTLGAILDYFEELRAIRFFAPEQFPPKETGLSAPRYRVRLEIDGPEGKETYLLEIGRRRNDAEVFAKVSNRQEIFTLPIQLEELLGANLVELRPFVALSLGELTAISLKTPEGSVSLERPQSQWLRVDAGSAEVEGALVGDLFSDIVDTHAEEAKEASEEMVKRFGLETPIVSGEMKTRTGVLSFSVGAHADEQGLWALRLNNSGPLYLISAEELDYLKRAPIRFQEQKSPSPPTP